MVDRAVVQQSLVSAIGIFAIAITGVGEHASGATSSPEEAGEEELSTQRSQPSGADSISSDQPRPLPASSSDVLGSCTWEHQSSTTSAEVPAQCPTGKRPVAGGCLSSASGRKIEWMRAYENSTATDPPDNAEMWYASSSVAGWTCEFTSSGSTNHSYALCCGT
jgi:hypothetical protein